MAVVARKIRRSFVGVWSLSGLVCDTFRLVTKAVPRADEVFPPETRALERLFESTRKRALERLFESTRKSTVPCEQHGAVKLLNIIKRDSAHNYVHKIFLPDILNISWKSRLNIYLGTFMIVFQLY
jgi:hypothetical protein